MKTIVKPLCQICLNRQAVKNMHIQETFFTRERIAAKSNRFEENIEKLWMQGGEVEESGLCSNELAGYQLRNLSRLV